MNTQLKQAIEVIRSIFESNCPFMLDFVELNGIAGEQFSLELLLFMTYLAASDNILEWDECEVVEAYTDISLSPEELKEFIANNIDYLKDIGLNIPLSFVMLVEADNRLIENGIRMERYSSELLLEIYKGLALEVIASDGEITIEEKIETNFLLTKVAAYIDLNLKKDSSIL